MLERLTTTSYAILGQLALRSWTPYELTTEMRRNFHYFWPRAESAIYAEIKRLADDGFVSAEQGYTGRRPRTTYTITPAGRRALDAWLATPPKEYALEFEGLLRVFFGLFGTREELRAAVEQTRAQAAELLAIGDAIAAEYRDGRAPFQNQLEVRAFVFDFLYRFALTVHDWAERTEATVAAWPELTSEERRERARATIEAALDAGGAV